MSGSKTILGFSGNQEPPATNPEEGLPPRAARTVIGRPAQPIPGVVPLPEASIPSTPSDEAPVGVPVAVTDEVTEQVSPQAIHTGKSRFPAMARLFGRWTTQGGFLSRSRMTGSDQDLLEVPRHVWPSRVAVFVVASLFSFLVALAVLKMHQCSGSFAKPPAALPAAPPPAASPTPTPAPTALPSPPPVVAGPQDPPSAEQPPSASPAPAASPKPRIQSPNPSKVHTGDDALMRPRI